MNSIGISEMEIDGKRFSSIVISLAWATDIARAGMITSLPSAMAFPTCDTFGLAKENGRKAHEISCCRLKRNTRLKIGLFHSRYCVHWHEFVDPSAAFLAEELREQHSWDEKTTRHCGPCSRRLAR